MSLTLSAGHPNDIFLSPHSDDICFSLGILALRRKAGKLLTIFPASSYSATFPRGNPAKRSTITRQRLAEDAAFSRECGLDACYLDFEDALLRGCQTRDSKLSGKVADSIESALMHNLMGATICDDPNFRPWLFSPSGIGGHVDHLAVLLVVLKNWNLLSQHYRIAFYEDLHYASNQLYRQRGLAKLTNLCGQPLQRYSFKLDETHQAIKMQLVRLYHSQLTPQISSIEAYTPADSQLMHPHEAIWLPQSDILQRPG